MEGSSTNDSSEQQPNQTQPETQAASPNRFQQIIDGVKILAQSTWDTRFSRRKGFEAAGVTVLAGAAAAACAEEPKAKPTETPKKITGPELKGALIDFAREIATSIAKTSIKTPDGLTVESIIQNLHRQTDRDVGVAGVAMLFVELAEEDPTNPLWLETAELFASWLTSVSHQDDTTGGIYWHDYVDPGANGESPDIYTSFDDGPLGIGDFFYRLGKVSGKQEYIDISRKTLLWHMGQAQKLTNPITGETMYIWQWDKAETSRDWEMGMAEGLLGILSAYADYYIRFPDQAEDIKKYIDGGFAFLQYAQANLATELGDSTYQKAVPQTGYISNNATGDTTMNSGWSWGSDGDIYVGSKLHKIFGEDKYRQHVANAVIWITNNNPGYGPLIRVKSNEITDVLERDPEGGDDTEYPTGFEEGNAGAIWALIQAYDEFGEASYLQLAEQFGNWLLDPSVAITRDGGICWREAMNSKQNKAIHVNLNNGGAGIQQALFDLFLRTKNPIYLAGSMASMAYIHANKITVNGQITWHDTDSGNDITGEKSWHFGSVGIASSVLRLAGGMDDVPGEAFALAQAG
jgi:hypothetical protein